MTLFIHIGIGKTGTTAIQDSLYADRSALKAAGLIYPDIGLDGSGHHNLCPPDYEQGDPVIAKAWQDIRAMIIAEPEKDYLLSSEHFIFSTPAHLDNICTLLKDIKVKIICYIRKQPLLIESTYLQWQKYSSNYIVGIQKFWRWHRAGYNFSYLINPWAQAFGSENIIARLFDREIIGTDVCEDFYRVIGAEYVSRNPKSSNDSILPEFSRLIEKLDKHSLKDIERRLLINELLVCSRILKRASCVSIIDHDMRRNIIDFYSASNEKFASEYLCEKQSALFLKN